MSSVNESKSIIFKENYGFIPGINAFFSESHNLIDKTTTFSPK